MYSETKTNETFSITPGFPTDPGAIIENNLFPLADIGVQPHGNLEVDPRSALKGNPYTYGETPLLTNPEQQGVFHRLLDRIAFNTPMDTPDAFQEFILSHFSSRFYRRQARNEQSYIDRSVIDLGTIEPETRVLLDLALVGSASPVQLLQLRQDIGMPSIELARVTHPYAVDMAVIDEMRSVVEYAIEQAGGELCDGSDCTTFGIESSHIMSSSGCEIDFVKLEMLDMTSDGEEECMKMLESARQRDSAKLTGVLTKRKRTLAVLEDGTKIIERSSFILRIDKDSELDQLIAHRMRNVVIDGNPNWKQEMTEACDLSALMGVLLADNRFDILVPLSTTVYAYNPERELEARALNKAKELDVIARGKAIMDSYGYELVTPVKF